LKLYLEGADRDNFGYLLFRLIAKADYQNIESLRKGFPKEVEMWENYIKTGE